VVEPQLLGDDVSIATAAHGNAATTRFCLESLLQSAAGDYELILIDDCSPDSGDVRSVYAGVKSRHPNTKVFAFGENLEYSGSLNAVLSHAAGRSVFFISNDIFVTPFYLRGLLDAARANPRLGILRGSSNYVDNGLATHNLPMSKEVRTIEDVFQVGAQVLGQFGRSTLKDPYLIGDAFLVNREVIDRIGTFDPWFYGYFADVDYGLRAQVAGFELALVPGAFAFHQRHANIGYLPEKQRQEKVNKRWMRVVENWARFKLKWGLPVTLSYESFGSLRWDELAATAASFDERRHFSAPGDYSRYLIE
jgi:GT2 family glycosyltransferase